MIGRLAPAANVEPEMPGFDISVSVRVCPPLASISRAVAIVTGTNASSATMLPGSGSSVERRPALSRPRYRPDGAAAGDFLTFFLAGLATGLAVVTVTAGSSTVPSAARRGLRLPTRTLKPQRRRSDAYAYANSHWYAPEYALRML